MRPSGINRINRPSPEGAAGLADVLVAHHGWGRCLAALRAVEIQAARSLGRFFASPVLDLGCGDGVVGAHAIAGWRTGIDVEPGPLGQARRHCPAVLRGDARSLPFRTASFRTVFSNSSLEHMDDLPLVLGEVSRVLAPGGAFVFLLPSRFFAQPIGPLPTLLGRRVWAEYNRLHRHVHLLSADEWRDSLAAHGLVARHVARYGSRRLARGFVLRDLLGNLAVSGRSPFVSVEKDGHPGRLLASRLPPGPRRIGPARSRRAPWLSIVAVKGEQQDRRYPAGPSRPARSVLPERVESRPKDRKE